MNYFFSILCASFLALGSEAANIAPVQFVSSSRIPNLKIPEQALGDRFGGSLAELKMAIQRQISKCRSQNLKESWNASGRIISRKEWCVDTGEWFLKVIEQSNSLQQVLDRAKTELDWFQSTGRSGKNDVYFTGYYHPKVKVRLKPDARFKYPFYKKPADLVLMQVNGRNVWRKSNGKAYFSRAQIDGDHVLKNKSLEIGYSESPLLVNTVMVQGSGILAVVDSDDSDGVDHEEAILFANFAATNGRAYTSIRDIFIKNGVPEEYWNYAGIYRYFSENPNEWERLAFQNESYVFFKSDQDGPFGGSAVKLTPRHSIAIDSSIFKYGLISLIQSEHPGVITENGVQTYEKYLQLTVTQDTGGKIKTPGRVDVYWGSGDDAKLGAGHPEIQGLLFFAVVKKSK